LPEAIEYEGLNTFLMMSDDVIILKDMNAIQPHSCMDGNNEAVLKCFPGILNLSPNACKLHRVSHRIFIRCYEYLILWLRLNLQQIKFSRKLVVSFYSSSTPV
jgi:hypothetical protein